MNKNLKKLSENRERLTFDLDFRIIRTGIKNGYDRFLASGYDVERCKKHHSQSNNKTDNYEITTFLESIGKLRSQGNQLLA